MLQNGKFRFTIQFSANTAEGELVGQYLEKLGRRKGYVIVQAITEYLETHSGSEESDLQEEIRLHADQVRNLERRLSVLRVGQPEVPVREKMPEAKTPEIDLTQTGDMDHDLLDMIQDLDLFL